MDDYIIEENVEADESKFTPPFQKIMINGQEKSIVNKLFLKKYIAYCKKYCATPTLNQEAVQFVSLAYAEL